MRWSDNHKWQLFLLTSWQNVPSCCWASRMSAAYLNLAPSCESLTVIHFPIKFLLWLFLFVAKLCLGRFAPEFHRISKPTNAVPFPRGLAYSEMAAVLLFSKLVVLTPLKPTEIIQGSEWMLRMQQRQSTNFKLLTSFKSIGPKYISCTKYPSN